MPFNELVLASHNAGKLKELQAMLGHAIRVRSVGEFSDVEPEETGLSFVENDAVNLLATVVGAAVAFLLVRSFA